MKFNFLKDHVRKGKFKLTYERIRDVFTKPMKIYRGILQVIQSSPYNVINHEVY